MKKCAILAMAAGGLFGVAHAQPVIDDSTSMPEISATAPEAGYNSRVVQLVFNVGPPSETGGDWRARATATKGGSRFSFSPGPGATTNPIGITGIGLAFSQDAAGLPADSTFDFRVKFYLDPVGGSPVNPLALPATPDATITGTLTAFTTPGYITFYAGAPVALTAPLNLGSATKLTSGFYVIEALASGTTLPSPSVGPFFRGLVAPSVGSSDGVRYADNDNNGVFIASEAFGSAANRRICYFNMAADVALPPPPNTVDLGCIPDAGLVRNDTLAAGGVKWYRICLNGDANINARQFFAVTSNGSSIDTAMALYNAGTGTVAGLSGSDQDDGDGVNAMLTFGTGNHAAVGDGLSFNGRDGQILAGEYYLAVAGGGASFGSSYNVNGGSAAGNFRLNFTTNTNGGALPPAVPPAVRTDLGVLTAPGTPGTNFTLPTYGVDWYKFTLCRDIAAPLYLDLDFSSTGTSIADPYSFLFNSSGSKVAESDDSSATSNRPQFSFGDAGPRTQGGSTVPFDGSSGASLPAGDYYLATALWSAGTLTSNDRWCVVGGSGSSLSYQVDFYTNLDSSTCSSCPPCAADYNQDGGVDGGDIASFFPDWESSASCADVNQDGGVDGGDIESFFGVWEAGGC
ncbi:MAG: hypothetical protein WCK33_04720 [Phycisphaerae bacterium]